MNKSIPSPKQVSKTERFGKFRQGRVFCLDVLEFILSGSSWRWKQHNYEITWRYWRSRQGRYKTQYFSEIKLCSPIEIMNLISTNVSLHRSSENVRVPFRDWKENEKTKQRKYKSTVLDLLGLCFSSKYCGVLHIRNHFLDLRSKPVSYRIR